MFVWYLKLSILACLSKSHYSEGLLQELEKSDFASWIYVSTTCTITNFFERSRERGTSFPFCMRLRCCLDITQCALDISIPCSRLDVAAISFTAQPHSIAIIGAGIDLHIGSQEDIYYHFSVLALGRSSIKEIGHQRHFIGCRSLNFGLDSSHPYPNIVLGLSKICQGDIFIMLLPYLWRIFQLFRQQKW